MRVGIEGDSDVGVTQRLRDDLGVDVSREQQFILCVPEVIEADRLRQFRCFLICVSSWSSRTFVALLQYGHNTRSGLSLVGLLADLSRAFSNLRLIALDRVTGGYL